MTETNNYGLCLPDDNDLYNIAVANENMQSIDTALSGLKVRFLISEEYSKITAKDSKTIYFVDGNKMYLGDVKLSADKASNGGTPVSIRSGQVNLFYRVNN